VIVGNQKSARAPRLSPAVMHGRCGRRVNRSAAFSSFSNQSAALETGSVTRKRASARRLLGSSSVVRVDDLHTIANRSEPAASS
jgi:hypothetical protein